MFCGGDGQLLIYSGSQSHTTRCGRASCSLWYAPVANVCDLLLFLDENRVNEIGRARQATFCFVGVMGNLKSNSHAHLKQKKTKI